MKLDFVDMLNYVKCVLVDNNALKPNNPLHQFRSRYSHIERVLGWSKRISADENCNKDALYTAAIFHDVGYAKGKEGHAHSSSLIFLDYAKKNNFDQEFSLFVSDIISKHSNKELLDDPKSPIELVLLMEADLLDEEGALGIGWDLLALGASNIESYYDMIPGILKHAGHILNQDYMKTKLAKKYWDLKKEFVRNFINELKMDLFVE